MNKKEKLITFAGILYLILYVWYNWNDLKKNIYQNSDNAAICKAAESFVYKNREKQSDIDNRAFKKTLSSFFLANKNIIHKKCPDTEKEILLILGKGQ